MAYPYTPFHTLAQSHLRTHSMDIVPNEALSLSLSLSQCATPETMPFASYNGEFVAGKTNTSTARPLHRSAQACSSRSTPTKLPVVPAQSTPLHLLVLPAWGSAGATLGTWRKPMVLRVSLLVCVCVCVCVYVCFQRGTMRVQAGSRIVMNEM